MVNSQFPRSPLSSNIFQGLRMQTSIWTFLPQKEPKERPGMHMSNLTWEIWWYAILLLLPKTSLTSPIVL